MFELRTKSLRKFSDLVSLPPQKSELPDKGGRMIPNRSLG